MDLIIILILVAVVTGVCKDAKFIVYLLGVLEIFFELIHYIGDKLTVIDINSFVDTYIPTSVFAVFAKYTTGIVYDIICWILVIGFILFLGYLIKYIIKRK